MRQYPNVVPEKGEELSRSMILSGRLPNANPGNFPQRFFPLPDKRVEQ